MSETSRRALLAGFGVAPIALATHATGAPAAESSELHALWNARRELRSAYLAAAARAAAAEKAMPWWAQPGPQLLASDGTFTGREVGWPAIAGRKPPERLGSFYNVRPTPTDLRTHYLNGIWGDTPKTRIAYRKALRALALRRREQKAERAKVALDELEKQRDGIAERISDITDAITNLRDTSADAIAASLMIGLLWTDHTRDDTSANIEGIEGALRIMLPSLTGGIAVDVADLLDNPDAPITERTAWIG
jgi:hypothetical protein